jgi:hypothetical protein
LTVDTNVLMSISVCLKEREEMTPQVTQVGKQMRLWYIDPKGKLIAADP